jgi:hypothetical protein
MVTPRPGVSPPTTGVETIRIPLTIEPQLV